MVVNDDLIVCNSIYHISVLNHNILKLVSRLLKLMDLFIKCHDLIKEEGRRSGLGRGEAWFDMLTIIFGDTSKFFEGHVLNKLPSTGGGFEELNMFLRT